MRPILNIPAFGLIIAGHARGVSAPAGTPAWGGESARMSETASAGTTAVNLSTAIAQNSMVFVVVNWISSSQTLSSIADDLGNTYTIRQNLNFNTDKNLAIATAPATTALQSSDNVTITWGSAAYTYRWVAVFYGSNCSSLDQSTNASAYGTSISAAASTTAADTLIVGAVQMSTAATYGSGNWTDIGSVHDSPGTRRTYYVYTVASSSGSQDPGGTASGNENWGAVWAAFA